ncbi:hypothetical protein ZIOFF_062783 [Zingiber officinale]|uniref:Cysteine proteinase inhibitor n=1 Tax=Zingiber officinale TaxID=94328 RepID=A0A8J5K9G4_ZINOF|nr:hypothetical protein ZIOFF_062783 [Zingiber officinale]
MFVVVKNALLEFVRVIKAREQEVTGTLHHLTVEVIDAGKKKIYEAKVWIKPWLNFKVRSYCDVVSKLLANRVGIDLSTS